MDDFAVSTQYHSARSLAISCRSVRMPGGGVILGVAGIVGDCRVSTGDGLAYGSGRGHSRRWHTGWPPCTPSSSSNVGSTPGLTGNVTADRRAACVPMLDDHEYWDTLSLTEEESSRPVSRARRGGDVRDGGCDGTSASGGRSHEPPRRARPGVPSVERGHIRGRYSIERSDSPGQTGPGFRSPSTAGR